MNKKNDTTQTVQETVESIKNKVMDLKKRLMVLRVGLKSELKNTSEIRKVRREIARLLTKLKNQG